MALALCSISCVLACLICTCCGRRFQTPVGGSFPESQAPSKSEHAVHGSLRLAQVPQGEDLSGGRLEAFARFCLAFTPVVACQQNSVFAFNRISAGSDLALSGRQTRITHHVPVMEDAYLKAKTRRNVADAITALLFANLGWQLLGPSLKRLDVPNINRFNKLQTQFIAALADPKASSGTGADKWRIWEQDPGPRGVKLTDYENKLAATGGKAPAGWTFDPSSWWVEEHGLIMETPAPLPLQKTTKAGGEMKVLAPERRYLVSGGRDTTSVLTVHSDGRWELDQGTLFDVTHLPCRSAIYTSAEGGTCKPTKEAQSFFPVKPGAKMPKLDGCNTQDWAVLFVLGVDG